MNLEVILQALHNVSLNEKCCTPRVCEVILSLLSLLLDHGILISKKYENSSQRPPGETNPEQKHQPTHCEKESSSSKTEERDKSLLSTHNILMDIVIRWIKH